MKAKECREKGFDPSNLACSTCELLPTEHKPTCLACCQSFRDVSMIQKPYESAVLVVPGKQSVSEEVKKLLDDDWDAIVETKGKTRLRMVETASSSQNYFFSFTPAYLYFFDNEKTASASTLKDLESTAQESIVLTGWKREDIRDMLHALLP